MSKIQKAVILIIRLIAIAILLVIIAVSARDLLEYNKGKTEAQALRVRVVEPIEPVEEKDIPPISVDFDALKKENGDVIGWLYCENTPINYPVVQSEDNDYYLRRGLDGKHLYSGTLFADYRSAGDFSGKNTLIYGHNMKNAEMFGSLINYENQEYFNKYPRMYLLTPSGNYKIELVAGIKEPSTSELYDALVNRDEAGRYIKEALSSSMFESGYTYSESDRFITLSTCSYDYADARFIVVGVLEKI